MWMITPKYMCTYHLKKEHDDLHMIAKRLRDGRSLIGLINKRHIEIATVRFRHSHVAFEMVARGISHKSGFPSLVHWIKKTEQVDAGAALQELIELCPDCARQYERSRRTSASLDSTSGVFRYTVDTHFLDMVDDDD
jgi:hypothetical protein